MNTPPEDSGISPKRRSKHKLVLRIIPREPLDTKRIVRALYAIVERQNERERAYLARLGVDLKAYQVIPRCIAHESLWHQWGVVRERSENSPVLVRCDKCQLEL